METKQEQRLEFDHCAYVPEFSDEKQEKICDNLLELGRKYQRVKRSLQNLELLFIKHGFEIKKPLIDSFWQELPNYNTTVK